MKFYDVADLAVRNLRESIFRNSLTTVGISVGVASLVAMLSLGIGLQQLASRRLEKSGLFDTVVATSRRDLRNFREQREEGPAPAESPALDETARQKIAHLPGVVEAYPDIRFTTELRFGDKPHLTTVAGVPFSAKNNNDAFEGVQGSFFSSEAAPEAILQKSFAEELLGIKPKPGASDANANIAELAKPLLGKELIMRYAERTASPSDSGSAASSTSTPGSSATSSSASTSATAVAAVGPGGNENAAYSVVSRRQGLKIVGITDLDPDTMRGTARARVFLPLKLVQELHVVQSSLRDTPATGMPTFSSLSVRVASPNQVPLVEDAIKKMGFNAFSLVDATRSMRQFFAVLDGFLAIFGSLALAVASIGIVNTLVMAILERRREIGIMKAVGASDADVRGLFFAEAGVMGLVGGAVGVTLGWVIGRLINFGTNIYLERQHFPPAQIWSVPLWLVLGAVAFSIVVSLVSGLYPAARAARLDPVQALRYE
jgi:putative ABC transport system permease protein